MRTAFVLLVLSILVGSGIAYSELNRKTEGLVHVTGVVENLDDAVKDAAAKNDSTLGRIEVVDGPELDFGTMRKGSRRSHKFVLKNVGASAADVWFLKSSCKCTVGKFDKATLQPGESTDVELEWLVEGVGDFGQTATIGTSVPRQEELKLTIRGKVGEAVVFDPPSLDAGQFLANDPKSFSGHLFNFEETPLSIESAIVADEVLSPKIKVKYQPSRKPEPDEFPSMSEAKEVVDFTVELEKGIPSGTITTNVVFNRRLKSGSKETIPLPLNGRCMNPIEIIAGNDYDENRDILKMGIGKSSDGLKKSFMLGVSTSEYPDAKITLKKIAPADISDKLKVTVGEPNVGKKRKIFPITIEVVPGTPAFEMNGSYGKDFAKVTFDTNMADAPEESIYLQVRITE